MQIRQLLALLESEFPASTAMEGDAIGLQLQSGREEVTSVCVMLEITDVTVDDAIKCGADCIITFHPFLYHPLRTITEGSRTGRLATRLIRAGIAVISLHTNFDSHPRGTNALFANRLQLQNARPLLPDAIWPNYGMGIVGELSENVTDMELAADVVRICSAPVILAPSSKINNIRKVAIVCGSGFSFLQNAIEAHAEAFITADVKYHGFHDASEHLVLISPGHYEMEQFVPRGIMEELKLLTGSSIQLAEAMSITNPIRYVSDSDGTKLR